MFRRHIYISELIPALISAGSLGAAVYGLATGRVPWFGAPELFTQVAQAQDPALFWMAIGLYLLAAAGLGLFSFRLLRGY